MSLNIKDPEAHQLAQAISGATVESITRVVTEALRERYARIEHRKGRASVEELLAIADRAAAHLKRPYVDHAELLYDETACRNDPGHLGDRAFVSLARAISTVLSRPDAPGQRP